MSTKTRAPRFNHVAMSVPADLLDEKGRGELLRFYGDVFGWEELPTETLDRQRLVLRAYSNEQFVFLIAEDPPMTCPRLDHFGMSVDTMEELDDMLERARAFQSRDDRVDIVDKHATDHDGFLVLTSFYVRYLLPMMIEVQHYDWAGAAEAPAT
jgi:hypothetical protein